MKNKKDYNQDKKLTAQRYYDAEHNPAILASLGAYGQSYEYDDRGNQISNTRLDANGNPMAGAAGWSVVQNTYNDKNQKISERYFDAQNNPCLNNQSFWKKIFIFSAAGASVSSPSAVIRTISAGPSS